MPLPVTGCGISPGVAQGKVRIVHDRDSAMAAKEGDIVVSRHFLPPLSSLARSASGFVFVGSEADHGVSYLREIWKPAVLVDDISAFTDGMRLTIDGKDGVIHPGEVAIEPYLHHEPLRSRPGTKIYLQTSIPWMAEKAAGLGTDGVGLLRTNLIVEEAGKHPYFHYVARGKVDELIGLIADGIERIAKAFFPRPVWVRTMDFCSDELALLQDGGTEVVEPNPLLGWRGLVRSLQQHELLDADLLAVKRAKEHGCDNVAVIFPLVRDISEYRAAKKRMAELGLVPHRDIKVGSLFETPSSILQINDFISDGLDLAFLGINDITMYMMVADRTNARMRSSYDPSNPAILNLCYNVLEKCQAKGIETTTSLLTPLKPHVRTFLSRGLTSMTLQADRINEIADLLIEAES